MPSVDTLTPVSQAVLPATARAVRAQPTLAHLAAATDLHSKGTASPSGHPLQRLPLMVVHLGESTWGQGQRYQCERGEVPSIDLVLEGAIRLVQDGRESLVTAGQVFVLKPGARQQYGACDGPARKLHLALGGVIADQFIASLPDRIVPADPLELRAAFTDLQRLLSELPPDHHVRASAMAYRLLLNLSLAHQAGSSNASLTPTVAAALHILETSGARDLDVRQVARTVGTSVSHLHRLFKDALGTSPLRYARERLIAQARDALSNTTLSCQEIAKRLGYDDPLYFSAVFKRITGVSPREYRKRHR